MKLNKTLKCFFIPAIVLILITYVLYGYIVTNNNNNKHNSNQKKTVVTQDMCPNTFTQLWVRDTCYVCPDGSQGISWVSPGYVQCSTENNSVLNATIK